MKTQYEFRYENLIMELIVRYDVPATEKVAFLLDFHQNSRDYYEKLCDFIYMISVGRTDHSLWITNSGKPVLSEPKNTIPGFLICRAGEVPVFEEDIVEQLLFAFDRIVRIIKSVESGHCNIAM